MGWRKVVGAAAVGASAGLVCGTAVATVTATPAPDPLSGGAGWVGAGLLGLLLAWLLLKHLPDKDKQVRELIQGCDATLQGVVTHFRAEQQEARKTFQAEQQESRKTFEDALTVIAERGDRRHESLLAALHQELSALHRELSELRRAG